MGLDDTSTARDCFIYMLLVQGTLIAEWLVVYGLLSFFVHSIEWFFLIEASVLARCCECNVSSKLGCKNCTFSHLLLHNRTTLKIKLNFCEFSSSGLELK